jgi:hypothetical protein
LRLPGLLRSLYYSRGIHSDRGLRRF